MKIKLAWIGKGVFFLALTWKSKIMRRPFGDGFLDLVCAREVCDTVAEPVWAETIFHPCRRILSKQTSQQLVVYRIWSPCKYKRLHWDSPIWGICDVGMPLGHQWNVDFTLHQMIGTIMPLGNMTVSHWRRKKTVGILPLVFPGFL